MKALALVCLGALVAGCRLVSPRQSSSPDAIGRGALVAAPEKSTPLTPDAVQYPAGRAYRITQLDSNTMGATQTWSTLGETIFESRDGVTFRDQQTGTVVEVRGTYRIKPLR